MTMKLLELSFCSARLTLFFKGEAIFASSISKFGNQCHRIDYDVLRSNKEVTNSTSLVPTHCLWCVIRITRTHFCFEARPPTWQGRGRNVFIDMHLPDLILRLSNHVILWISLFHERSSIPSRHVSGKSRRRNYKAWSVLFSFINSRCCPPCA